MAKVRITYLVPTTIEVDLPDDMVADWECLEPYHTSAETLIAKANETNQIPELEHSSFHCTGAVIEIESVGLCFDGFGYIRIDGMEY